MSGIVSGHLTLLDRGGAWIAAKRIVDAIDREGTAWIEALRPSEKSTSRTERIGAKLDYEIGRSAQAPLTVSLLRSLGSGARVRRLLQAKGGPDVFNLHWLPGHLESNLLTQLTGPIVWTLHDMNPFSGLCHHSFACQGFRTGCHACPQAPALLQPIVEREFVAKSRFAPRVSAVVAPSGWLASLAESSEIFGEVPTYVIPNPVPMDAFSPGRRAKARRMLHVEEDLVVGLLGDGYDATKNAKMAWKVTEDLVNAVGMPLVVLSFGPRLATIAARHIEIQVGADQDAMADALAACDLLVYTSLADNLPNLVAEAQTAGLPVVALKTGGVGEAMSHGQTGFLTLSPADAFSATRALIMDADLRGRFSSAAAAFAAERFSPTRIASAYLEVYEAALGQPNQLRT